MKNKKSRNTHYQLTKSFAAKMLPLSFTVGFFICLVVPVSYYFIIYRDLTRQAVLHAEYLASIFRETVEETPLEWEKKIKSYIISAADISRVRFFDRRHNSISDIINNENCHRFVSAEKTAFFAGKIYAFVEVSICLDKQFRYAVMLLGGSTISGTLIGLFLF